MGERDMSARPSDRFVVIHIGARAHRAYPMMRHVVLRVSVW